MISETLVLCQAPSRLQNGTVVVSVSLNGVDFLPSGLLFLYYTPIVLGSLLPRGGVTHGGTLVTLYVSSGTLSPLDVSQVNTASELHTIGCGTDSVPVCPLCKFGEDVVNATFINNDQLSCRSPERVAGDVQVRVSVNGATFSSNLLF